MIDTTYIQLINNVLKNGEKRPSRNEPTTSLFGTNITFDIQQTGLPLISLRRMHMPGIVGEFRAFLHDAKTVEEFEELGCNFWHIFAEEDNSLILDYAPRTQLPAVIDNIKNDPYSRRHIINLWNHERIKDLSLPCCHYSYQFYVRGDAYIDMIWTQRSVDIAVGLPSDMVIAALYVQHICNETNYKPGKVIMNFGDAHIYDKHLDNIDLLLTQPVTTTKLDFTWNNVTERLTCDAYNPNKPIKFELIK